MPAQKSLLWCPLALNPVRFRAVLMPALCPVRILLKKTIV